MGFDTTPTPAPWDEARLRSALDAWDELPAGPRRNQAARTLLAALRELSRDEANALINDIYTRFRAQELRERVKGYAERPRLS
jgi:hypothetical protein